MKKLEKSLPKSPGVYLFKDSSDTIIYIGKAKSLITRVRSYFLKRSHNWRTDSLLEEAATVDYIVTASEADALILEAELVKKHQPKFNVLLKEGQPFLYILFTDADIPEMKLVRTKKEKGTYFGPLLHKMKTRSVFSYLVQTFKLKRCNKKIANGCLDYHLGTCAGSCKENFDIAEYRTHIDLAMQALKSDRRAFLAQLEQSIEQHNKNHAFEQSKRLNTYREHIDTIFDTLHAKYTLAKLEDTVAAVTLKRAFIAPAAATINTELQALVAAPRPINTIDCFDISHFQSSFMVGSCVRWHNGALDKNKFRRFKIKTLDIQDDYAALREIVTRRYRKGDLPDLILIDGGQGQRNAVKDLVAGTPCASLAKREERLFADAHPQGILLDLQTDVGKVLIALRDYAHHFAVSYHKKRRHAE